MKRMICLLLTLLVLMVPVAAAEFDTVYDLWTWLEAEENMPDWYCGGSSTDGSMENMTIVVNVPEAEGELYAMLADPSGLTVIVSETAFSRKNLLWAQNEITNAYMGGKNPPVAGVGVGWTTVDGQVTGFGESGKEDRIVVDVLEEYAPMITRELQALYGDMVYVQTVSGYAQTGDSSLPTAEEQSAGIESWGDIAAAVLVLAAVVIVSVMNYRKKKKARTR